MNPSPWFADPIQFSSIFGALVGGIGGPLCGVLGSLAGALAPKGKAKRFIVGGFVAVISISVVLLVIGLYALLTGQPFPIWFAFLLPGIIFSCAMGWGLPAVLMRYREAEKNKPQ